MAKRAKKAVRKHSIAPRARRAAGDEPERKAGKYKAAAKLLIDGRLVAAGEVFTSDKPPGKKWIPVDATAKAAVGDREIQDRAGRPLTNLEQAEEEAKADEEARVAPHRAKTEEAAKGSSGHKRASPGKSVTQQHMDGEEPTVGHIHDNED